MQSNFDASVTLVLKSEGGYSDNPADPGGATNMGITRRTLAAWRKVAPWQALPKSAVATLGRQEATAIYRANYWDRVQGDNLPAGVDYAVFDYAVNSGPKRAAQELQRVLGVPADGVIGPQTLAAASKADPVVVINALCSRRQSFLESLPTFKTFGRGWTDRVTRIRTDALAMASQSPAQASKPAPKPSSVPTRKPVAKSAGLAAALAAILATLYAFLKSKGILP